MLHYYYHLFLYFIAFLCMVGKWGTVNCRFRVPTVKKKPRALVSQQSSKVLRKLQHSYSMARLQVHCVRVAHKEALQERLKGQMAVTDGQDNFLKPSGTAGELIQFPRTLEPTVSYKNHSTQRLQQVTSNSEWHGASVCRKA